MATKKQELELKTYFVTVTAEVSCLVEVKATSWKDAANLAREKAESHLSIEESEDEDGTVQDVDLDWNEPSQNDVEEE